MKEAYAAEFAATIERAEKQIILARHGRRLLKLLDDSPIIPGDVRPAFQHFNQSRQILNDAEEDLRDWVPELEDVPSRAEGILESNLMPRAASMATTVGGHAGNGNGDASAVQGEHSRIGTGSSAASVTTGTEYAGSVPGGYDTIGVVYAHEAQTPQVVA